MRTLPLLALLACSADDPADDVSACNGHPDLCERRFDELVVPMTHNAMSSEELGWLGPNQTFDLPRQLDDGIRGFMLDTHLDDDGNPALCHSYCSLGSTPLADGLRTFTDFLDANPGEVLVFMIQNGIDSDTTAEAFEQADLRRYTYAHDPSAPWPTLGDLVADDTRLVVFHEGGGTDPDWYMDGYAGYVWDTDYSAQTADDFACDRLRGDTDHALYLMNHFLTAPIASADLADQVNHNPLLIDRARQCASEAGQPVNWISVDFYDIGDVVETAAILNGIAPG